MTAATMHTQAKLKISGFAHAEGHQDDEIQFVFECLVSAAKPAESG